MSRLLPLAALMTIVLVSGCTSHSWTKVQRRYVASYSETFDRIPVECKKCGMSLKKKDPEAGVMVLNSHRIADKLLTGSLINMFAGDEVIVKVQRISPTTTQVWIDSKARGQIGPDFGRTDRNVTELAATLDRVWAQVEATEERGEKRPGAASQPSPPADSGKRL